MTPIESTESRRATGCVGAGVDFSFRLAFRESWGLVNLLQIAGRASRSGEYADTEVWDFRHDESGGLSLHPRAEVALGALADIFNECAKDQRQPSPGDRTAALLVGAADGLHAHGADGRFES